MLEAVLDYFNQSCNLERDWSQDSQCCARAGLAIQSSASTGRLNQ